MIGFFSDPILCGIMCRMDNSNLDDTRPRPVEPAAQEPEDPQATRPVEIQADATDPAGLDATRPVPVAKTHKDPSLLDRNQPGVAQEHPYPPASDLEETIPPPGMVGLQDGADSAGLPPDRSGPGASGMKPRRISWRRWTIFGLLALVLIAASSAFLGYSTGINDRKRAEADQVTSRAEEQYQLGLQDLEAHHYDLARQRFEYVIQLNPNYPGVTDKLAEVLMRMNSTATPTVAPTPTVTPTPDLRGVEELFQQAQTELANYNWSAAIDTLLALRKADLNYRAVWVDDMLYVSFRNRGADKILKEGDLEGGIYDLTLAEQFGPLDADADSYQTWAGLYITGASFWELDWSQAVFYFAQIAPALPNLRDGSGWTAIERYRLALVGYGGQLADAKDWCAAVEQYDLALSLGEDDQVREARDFAAEKCDETNRPQPPPQESVEPTPTATGEATPLPTETEPTQPPPEATPTPPEEPSPTPGS